MTEGLPIISASAGNGRPTYINWQSQETMNIRGELIDEVDNGVTFLRLIMKGDGTWCLLDDWQPKSQSVTWKSPLFLNDDAVTGSKVKSCYKVFDAFGIVHTKVISIVKLCIKEAKSASSARSTFHKRPQMWRNNIQHDNHFLHGPAFVENELFKNRTSVLQHPTYSP